jgi:hypothetical protein
MATIYSPSGALIRETFDTPRNTSHGTALMVVLIFPSEGVRVSTFRRRLMERLSGPVLRADMASRLL